MHSSINLLGMKATKHTFRRINSRRTTGHAYFFPAGKCVIDLTGHLEEKPVKEYRNILDNILKREGVAYTKATWSRTCGCTCGCSPGFRVKGLKHFDVFIDVK
jgi:hypothetical protein